MNHSQANRHLASRTGAAILLGKEKDSPVTYGDLARKYPHANWDALSTVSIPAIGIATDLVGAEVQQVALAGFITPPSRAQIEKNPNTPLVINNTLSPLVVGAFGDLPRRYDSSYVSALYVEFSFVEKELPLGNIEMEFCSLPDRVLETINAQHASDAPLTSQDILLLSTNTVSRFLSAVHTAAYGDPSGLDMEREKLFSDPSHAALLSLGLEFQKLELANNLRDVLPSATLPSEASLQQVLAAHNRFAQQVDARNAIFGLQSIESTTPDVVIIIPAQTQEDAQTSLQATGG